MNYPPNADRCPEDIEDELNRYIEHHVPLGDFLQAVVEDRLVESFARADCRNYECLGDIAAWIYCNMPLGLRGPEGYRRHIAGREEEK